MCVASWSETCSLETGCALPHWPDGPKRGREGTNEIMSALANQVSDLSSEMGFVFGHGEAATALNAVVAEVASTDMPVLLMGESGTGKEIYARLIHRLSTYSRGPLRKLVCRTVDPGVLLTQVHQAFQRNQEDGETGTAFLDGVDELDLPSQRVILSLLPDGEPKGSTEKKSARLISSTSRNLESETAAGQFRRELYFRINGVCLRLPPLRERKEDIPELARYFLSKCAGELKRETPVLSEEALEFLTVYDWPGNIRELENVIKKMVILGDTKMAFGDLSTGASKQSRTDSDVRFSSLKVAARAASRRTERELILQALERTHWNRKRAAQELQVSYKSLLCKIKEIGLQSRDSEEI
jgi:two-component system, NtrC family, response regulator AtoC